MGGGGFGRRGLCLRISTLRGCRQDEATWKIFALMPIAAFTFRTFTALVGIVFAGVGGAARLARRTNQTICGNQLSRVPKGAIISFRTLAGLASQRGSDNFGRRGGGRRRRGARMLGSRNSLSRSSRKQYSIGERFIAMPILTRTRSSLSTADISSAAVCNASRMLCRVLRLHHALSRNRVIWVPKCTCALRLLTQQRV